MKMKTRTDGQDSDGLQVNVRRARRAREDLQDYRNQNYIGGLLDEVVFDLQNSGSDMSFLYANGCLDAPDFIPSGSMVNRGPMFARGGCETYDRGVYERGIDLADAMALEKELSEMFSHASD